MKAIDTIGEPFPSVTHILKQQASDVNQDSSVVLPKEETVENDVQEEAAETLMCHRQQNTRKSPTRIFKDLCCGCFIPMTP